MSDTKIEPLKEQSPETQEINDFQNLEHHQPTGDEVVQMEVKTPPPTKKKKGRPRTRPEPKNVEKHTMTQARLDSLARARKIRRDKIRARKVLEKNAEDERHVLESLGRMVINNSNITLDEQKNNLAVQIGVQNAKQGEIDKPMISLGTFKQGQKPSATPGEEFNQPKPFKPVKTVENISNGGEYQNVYSKDLTFHL